MSDTNEQAPRILDLPIGLDATGMRQEFDSLGTVEVPAGHYWGVSSWWAGRSARRSLFTPTIT